jgi:hypothetical protein
MTNPAKRHHFLPQFYLRHFTDADGRLVRTVKTPAGQLREERYSPKTVGCEADLYSIETEINFHPVKNPDQVETGIFGPIDNCAAPVMRRLLDHAPSALNDTERETWAIFVNSLMERHPQRLRTRDKLAETKALEHTEGLLAGLPEETRPLWTRAISRLDVRALSHNAVRGAMIKAIRDEEALDYFRGMLWVKVCLHAPAQFELLTSDNAVLTNFGQPWPIEIMTLALSPTKLLVMVKRDMGLNEDHYLKMAVLHNLELFRQSECIYSRQPLQDMEALRTRYAAELSLHEHPWDQR